ncbi:MAG: ATP-binding cassette domain-containing protein [Ruminococcus sp.]|nr:ATP-binding cassette domain-containing protein [Ruminococcus sp.]
MLTPTSGVCTIGGKIPTQNRKDYVREIGVVFGQRTQLWWDLALRETYMVLKEIYEIPDKDYNERMAFLNEVLELDSFITSPVRTLSLGQRMRADIAASLLHNPKVLFLDEPTIGLDVVVKDNIRKAIQKINAESGTTVILTTHDLEDIELLCNRIVMIDKGKKVFDGELSELRRKYGQMRELCFELKDKADESKLDYDKNFSFAEGDLSVEVKSAMVNVRFNSDTVSVEDMLSYTLSKVHVKDISVKDADIEEIIRRLYIGGGETDETSVSDI